MSVVRKLFERNCPNILSIILKNTDFALIDKRFDQHMDSLGILMGSGNKEILVKTTFIDLLLRSDEGSDDFIKSFVKYCDELVKDTLTKIESKHNKGIRNSFIGKITNLDSWNYLNPIGEIAALNNLLFSSQFSLEQIEYKMPNGKKADFLLRNIENNHKSLVEIVNIHTRDGIEGEELKNSIINKLSQKVLTEKTFIPYLPHIFLPIIWSFDYDIYLPLEEFFLDFKASNGEKYIPDSYILGFNGFVQHINTITNERIIRFGFVNEIIKDYKKDLKRI